MKDLKLNKRNDLEIPLSCIRIGKLNSFIK